MRPDITHEEQFYLDNLWRWASGIPERPLPPKLPKLPVLLNTEWSVEFENAMRKRLIQGAFRYGRISRASNKPKYRRIASIRSRLNAYLKDHATEHLVDVANLCLLEFAERGETLHYVPTTYLHHIETAPSAPITTT